MERDLRSRCHSYARRWAGRGLAVAGALTLTWALGGEVVIHGLVNSANYFYTLDADFDQGTLFNVNHTAPNNNQLQLNQNLTTFPVMWIANAGEDTVSKIDTSQNFGAVPGCEVARYRTGFGPAGQPGYQPHLNSAYTGPAPSRTAVDSQGNVYVANRRFDGRQPEVMKILASGFIDRNGNGVEDTSKDLNNDCMITGAEILPMGDTNGNGLVEAAEIRDERIVYVTPYGVNNGLGRSLCIDVGGSLWGGQYNAGNYFKLDAVTGAPLAGPVAVPGNNPYGCVVDAGGHLWGASLGATLAQVNTNTNTLVAVRNHGAFGSDYGIAVGQDASGNTRVYQANFSGNTYTEFNTATNLFSAPAALKFSAVGVAVDSQGNIIVGNWGGNQVVKFTPAGAVIWSSVAANQGEIRGVVVDSNDDVWLIHLGAHTVSKHRGTDGAQQGVRPVGNSPYTYTDATGLQRFNTTQPTGNWTVVQDGGAGTVWGTITWNTEGQGTVPAGASLVVEARASDNQGSLGSLAYVPVSNGAAFNMPGRYIEVRATLTANSQGQSPILSDIRVQAQQQQQMVCDIDGDRDVDKNDTNLIMAGRTPTAAPGDPRDANGDGKIDIVDARYCAAKCTRPNCAL